jgi:hypothetical protein
LVLSLHCLVFLIFFAGVVPVFLARGNGIFFMENRGDLIVGARAFSGGALEALFLFLFW